MRSRKKQTLIFTAVTILGLIIIAGVVFLMTRDKGMVSYVNRVDKFSMKYPKEWEMIEGKNGTSVMFMSPKEGELDSFVENVNIVVQPLGEEKVNINQYSELAVKQMEAVFKNNLVVLEADKDVYFASNPGFKFQYRGKTDQHYEMYGLHFWTIKNNRAYQFTYMSTSPYENDLFQPYVEKMIKSFKIRK